MAELFQDIEVLKELDALKDQLRSLKEENAINTDKSLFCATAKVDEIREFTNSMVNCKGDLDVINLILAANEPLMSDNDCARVSLSTKNQAHVIKMVQNLVEILKKEANQSLQLKNMEKVKQDLIEVYSLRRNYHNLLNALNNLSINLEKSVNKE